MLGTKTEELSNQRPKTKAQKEMTDKLQVMLERLDEDTAKLLMLRFYGEFSFKELAEMRSEPVGTTLSKVHRGLKKLREVMERKND